MEFGHNFLIFRLRCGLPTLGWHSASAAHRSGTVPHRLRFCSLLFGMPISAGRDSSNEIILMIINKTPLLAELFSDYTTAGLSIRILAHFGTFNGRRPGPLRVARSFQNSSRIVSPFSVSISFIGCAGRNAQAHATLQIPSDLTDCSPAESIRHLVNCASLHAVLRSKHLLLISFLSPPRLCR